VVETLQQKPEARQGTTGRIKLNDFEREIVNYIFDKIRLTYGDQKFKATFKDQGSLNETKREWAKSLLKSVQTGRKDGESDINYGMRVRAKVDGMFEEVKHMTHNDPRWDWPSLKLICGYMTSHSKVPACHRTFRPEKALPKPPELIEEENAAAKSALDNLRGLF
jgi:hypothetical protein